MFLQPATTFTLTGASAQGVRVGAASPSCVRIGSQRRALFKVAGKPLKGTGTPYIDAGRRGPGKVQITHC